MGGVLLSEQLSQQTSIFGLKLWVVLGICVGATIVIVLFLISLYIITSRTRRSSSSHIINKQHLPTTTTTNSSTNIPNVSREIQEIKIIQPAADKQDGLLLRLDDRDEQGEEEVKVQPQRIHIEIGKENRITYPDRNGSGEQMGALSVVPEVSHLGWGHRYTLQELEAATNEFADHENVIGEGCHGIVYQGVFIDNTKIC